eukprot:GHVU01144213.1.p1 GENE.GHVU01144213.1~~GHVU01144213.1.p1  ORF type:complete len:2874 (+),score=227.32 GHVU01144213.1:1224-8624(+)
MSENREITGTMDLSGSDDFSEGAMTPATGISDTVRRMRWIMTAHCLKRPTQQERVPNSVLLEYEGLLASGVVERGTDTNSLAVLLMRECSSTEGLRVNKRLSKIGGNLLRLSLLEDNMRRRVADPNVKIERGPHIIDTGRRRITFSRERDMLRFLQALNRGQGESVTLNGSVTIEWYQQRDQPVVPSERSNRRTRAPTASKKKTSTRKSSSTSSSSSSSSEAAARRDTKRRKDRKSRTRVKSPESLSSAESLPLTRPARETIGSCRLVDRSEVIDVDEEAGQIGIKSEVPSGELVEPNIKAKKGVTSTYRSGLAPVARAALEDGQGRSRYTTIHDDTQPGAGKSAHGMRETSSGPERERIKEGIRQAEMKRVAAERNVKSEGAAGTSSAELPPPSNRLPGCRREKLERQLRQGLANYIKDGKLDAAVLDDPKILELLKAAPESVKPEGATSSGSGEKVSRKDSDIWSHEGWNLAGESGTSSARRRSPCGHNQESGHQQEKEASGQEERQDMTSRREELSRRGDAPRDDRRRRSPSPRYADRRPDYGRIGLYDPRDNNDNDYGRRDSHDGRRQLDESGRSYHQYEGSASIGYPDQRRVRPEGGVPFNQRTDRYQTFVEQERETARLAPEWQLGYQERRHDIRPDPMQEAINAPLRRRYPPERASYLQDIATWQSAGVLMSAMNRNEFQNWDGGTWPGWLYGRTALYGQPKELTLAMANPPGYQLEATAFRTLYGRNMGSRDCPLAPGWYLYAEHERIITDMVSTEMSHCVCHEMRMELLVDSWLTLASIEVIVAWMRGINLNRVASEEQLANHIANFLRECRYCFGWGLIVDLITQSQRLIHVPTWRYRIDHFPDPTSPVTMHWISMRGIQAHMGPEYLELITDLVERLCWTPTDSDEYLETWRSLTDPQREEYDRATSHVAMWVSAYRARLNRNRQNARARLEALGTPTGPPGKWIRTSGAGGDCVEFPGPTFPRREHIPDEVLNWRALATMPEGLAARGVPGVEMNRRGSVHSTASGPPAVSGNGNDSSAFGTQSKASGPQRKAVPTAPKNTAPTGTASKHIATKALPPPKKAVPVATTSGRNEEIDLSREDDTPGALRGATPQAIVDAMTTGAFLVPPSKTAAVTVPVPKSTMEARETVAPAGVSNEGDLEESVGSTKQEATESDNCTRKSSNAERPVASAVASGSNEVASVPVASAVANGSHEGATGPIATAISSGSNEVANIPVVSAVASVGSEGTNVPVGKGVVKKKAITNVSPPNRTPAKVALQTVEGKIMAVRSPSQIVSGPSGKQIASSGSVSSSSTSSDSPAKKAVSAINPVASSLSKKGAKARSSAPSSSKATVAPAKIAPKKRSNTSATCSSPPTTPSPDASEGRMTRSMYRNSVPATETEVSPREALGSPRKKAVPASYTRASVATSESTGKEAEPVRGRTLVYDSDEEREALEAVKRETMDVEPSGSSVTNEDSDSSAAVAPEEAETLKEEAVVVVPSEGSQVHRNDNDNDERMTGELSEEEVEETAAGNDDPPSGAPQTECKLAVFDETLTYTDLHSRVVSDPRSSDTSFSDSCPYFWLQQWSPLKMIPFIHENRRAACRVWANELAPEQAFERYNHHNSRSAGLFWPVFIDYAYALMDFATDAGDYAICGRRFRQSIAQQLAVMANELVPKNLSIPFRDFYYAQSCGELFPFHPDLQVWAACCGIQTLSDLAWMSAMERIKEDYVDSRPFLGYRRVPLGEYVRTARIFDDQVQQYYPFIAGYSDDYSECSSGVSVPCGGRTNLYEHDLHPDFSLYDESEDGDESSSTSADDYISTVCDTNYVSSSEMSDSELSVDMDPVDKDPNSCSRDCDFMDAEKWPRLDAYVHDTYSSSSNDSSSNTDSSDSTSSDCTIESACYDTRYEKVRSTPSLFDSSVDYVCRISKHKKLRVRLLRDVDDEIPIRKEEPKERGAVVPSSTSTTSDTSTTSMTSNSCAFSMDVPTCRLNACLKSCSALGTEGFLSSLGSFCAECTEWGRLRSDYRITVDLRRVNSKLHELEFPFPDLEEIGEYLTGARYFASIDLCDGYTQCPLAKSSQELFSLISQQGVFSPTRVPQGASCSVAYFQATMENLFAPVLRKGVLIYLDDILIYAKTLEEFYDILETVLRISEEHFLKLSAKKSHLFATEVEWCGKLISADGIRHKWDRIEALVNMPLPENGAQLYQFYSAAGWMRTHIPNFSSKSAPLLRCLDLVKKAAKSLKKAKCRKIPLDKRVEWGPECIAAYEVLKEALVAQVQLAHPDSEQQLIISGDASATHWGGVITQVPDSEWKQLLRQNVGLTPEDEIPKTSRVGPKLTDVAGLSHQPLAFISGQFKGAQLRWSTLEREAYVIRTILLRFEHLCYRTKGVIILTDHRNLEFLLGRDTQNPNFPQFVKDKLYRWYLSIMSIPFRIRYLPGESNDWGDLLSRWGSSGLNQCVGALEHCNLPWPEPEEV